jgi:hypothetical protein
VLNRRFRTKLKKQFKFGIFFASDAVFEALSRNDVSDVVS